MINSILFKTLLFLSLFILPTIQQSPGNGDITIGSGNGTTIGSGNGTINGNTNTTAPVGGVLPTVRPDGTCDPFRAVCPSYTNGTDVCDAVQVAGQIIVNSPNDTSFFYVNEDINITISYTSNVDPRYPQSFVSIWYRRLGSIDDFISLGNMTRGTNSRMVQISSVSAGSYELLLLADGIDSTRRNKAGIRTSCIPDGWPYSSPKPFKLLERNTVQPFSNPYGPNNGAHSIFSVSASLWTTFFISFFTLH